MRIIEYTHRHCHSIIKDNPLYLQRYNQFMGALASITDEELIMDFNARKLAHPSLKSITPGLNAILKQRRETIPGWQSEVYIFNDRLGLVNNTEWRLDFACETFSVEVAFNHGEAIAWNLLKPTLASELNHVEKAIQTQLGIYVCATDNMKRQANIDGASGSFEKVMRYLPAMMNQLTIPMMIIGLDGFDTFAIDKNTKSIVML